LIQTLFGEPQLPFEELQRLRFLFEPDLSPAQRFGGFMRTGEARSIARSGPPATGTAILVG
jgi:hypothetical protein